MNIFIGLLLAISALFLILLVLVQRGRGGGLSGALGGLGGQSAFGAKAGDVFTKITIVTAIIWIVLCVISVRYLGEQESKIGGFGGSGPLPSGAGQAAPGPATDQTSGGQGAPKSNGGGQSQP